MRKVSVMILLLLAAGPPGEAQEDVFVVNLPDVQGITGDVSIKKPIPHTTMVRLDERIVAPVERSETGALVSGGVVDASGFRGAVLSLVGLVQGKLTTEGSVGAVLLPEEEPILQAFDEAGVINLGLDVTVGVRPGESYFGDSKAEQLAFQRYRVYYYNTTDRAVSVRLYAYLSN